MESGIYKILNTVNGKQYIGSAINLSRRKSQHWSDLAKKIHHNPHLQSVWNKYGEAAFEFLVVGKCPPERLIELEQEVMDHLKPEYNIALTANSSLGIVRSIDQRLRMSKSQKGRVISDECRRKISEANIGNTKCLGYKHSEETKLRMSESAKKRHKENKMNTLTIKSNGEVSRA